MIGINGTDLYTNGAYIDYEYEGMPYDEKGVECVKIIIHQER